MSYVRTSGKTHTFRHQPLLQFSQAGAVQNTWYTVLEAANVRLKYIEANCTVADETIQLRITIDGEEATVSKAATAATHYYIVMDDDINCKNLVLGVTVYNATRYTSMEGRNVKIEIRKTTAGGASALQAQVMYETEE